VADDLHVAFFVLAVALMLVHELDAMQRHEWRLFPGLSQLPDRLGMQVSIWVHVPLFGIILWYGALAIGTGGDRFSLGFSGFCIAHAFVHLAFDWHPRFEFENLLLRTIIWSCALAGAAALIASLAQTASSGGAS